MSEELPLPKWAAYYFLAQAAGVLIWWLFLFERPDVRAVFVAPGDWQAFFPLCLPDALIYGALGCVTATAILRRAACARGVLLVMLGGSAYATLDAFAYAASSGHGWIGVALMAPTLAIPAYLCWRDLK